MRTTSIILAVALLSGVGCGDGSRDESGSASFQQEAAPPQGAPAGIPTMPTREDANADKTSGAPGTPGAPGAPGATIDRQIIRSGEISLTVESLDSASRALSGLVSSAGGYISGSTRNRMSGSALTGTVEVRVPSARFDGLVAGVRTLGVVEFEAITASDVTEEYIDLEARLKGQQQLEARILKLLDERPGKLADVVEIEQKLAEIRSVIEGIQGRLRYLGARVAHSTLTVRMTEQGAIGTSQTDTFSGRMSRAFDEGTDALVQFLAGLLTLLIGLLPFIAIGLVIWWIVRRQMRARKEKATVAAATTHPPATAPTMSPTRDEPGA